MNYCHHLASVFCKLFTFQASSPKPLGRLEPNLAGMFLGWSSTKLLFFVPVGKCSNAFFSETTNMIKAKLYMNVHWMVLYNLKVFCSDMKLKMAATAGLSLTLDPMGKMFQNASSLKLLGQLKPNCPGMIIGRSSTNFMFFMPIGNPRWPPPQYID